MRFGIRHLGGMSLMQLLAISILRLAAPIMLLASATRTLIEIDANIRTQSGTTRHLQ